MATLHRSLILRRMGSAAPDLQKALDTFLKQAVGLSIPYFPSTAIPNPHPNGFNGHLPAPSIVFPWPLFICTMGTPLMGQLSPARCP
ncbi:MAG: hypothetical protein OEW09_10890 [Anaerolineae bacterium]|nr:hypothetical protein [Anaerolineae bacterium]